LGLTRLGVLGWPVAHSRSPAMQNAALQAAGLSDWRYQRLPISPALLAETVRALHGAGFAGANVTIPHKQAALVLADEATATARAIGSARAAAYALAHAGAAVAVWNRDPQRARELAGDLGVQAVAAPVPADVLVNCTSVGLTDPSSTFKDLPVRADSVGEYACVVDLVYRAGGTVLAQEARRRGSQVIDGLEILVQQGALSFTGWTGRVAPLQVMREAATR
jgi:shikimate dehydrogenase